MLERCPGLRVMVTSRHALRIRGEREVRLDPLPVPSAVAADPEAEPTVRLFVARARDASPSFALTPENTESVTELCRRLEGLPLALELAAAWVPLLDPPELLARLAHSLDLDLAGRGPDIPERQRTLRAAMDWSYDLLESEERELLGRLSVFAGDFSLEAVESICGGRELDVTGNLASLIDKSLVAAARESVGTEPRFRMLAAIRAYAEQRLESSGTAEQTRRRHLAWYRELAGRAQPYLCGPGQREWAMRLDPDRADLRTAVATALELGKEEVVVEIVWGVIVFYFVRDAVEEPDSWLRAVAEREPELDRVASAKLYSLLALTRIVHGDYEHASERLQSALEVFRERRMTFESAVTLHQLAWVRYQLEGAPEGAREALEESTRLFDSIGHDWGVALVETMLGTVLSALGDLSAAEAHHLRSLERSRLIENEPLIATALLQIGLVRVLDGRAGEALPSLTEAAETIINGGYRTEASYWLDTLAGVALAQDRPQAAAVALTVAEHAREQMGLIAWPTLNEISARFVAEARSAMGEAGYSRARQDATDDDPLGVMEELLAELR